MYLLPLAAFILLKCYTIFRLARLISSAFHLDLCSSLISSYVFFFIFELAAIFVLSALVWLDSLPFWLLHLLFFTLIFFASRGKTGVPVVGMERAHFSFVIPSLFTVALATLFVRGFFLSDLTQDAQAYGLTRIALWLQEKTVFVYMPSIQVAIFANEWNGELNALMYSLSCASLLGASFGNIDVYLITFLASYWFGLVVSRNHLISLAAAGLLSLTPATIGLAITVKGDLLAIAGLIMAVGWLLRARTSPSPEFSMVQAVFALVLSIASKLTVAPPAFLLLAYAAGWMILHRVSFIAFSLAALGSLVLGLKFLANFVVYGSPFFRSPHEKPFFSLQNFLENSELVARSLFQTGIGTQEFWALSAGMGISGFIWVLALISGCFSMPRHRDLPVLLIVLAGTLLAMSLMPPFGWNFRYFLPGIAVLMLYSCVKSLTNVDARLSAHVLNVSVALCLATTLAATLVSGDFKGRSDSRRIWRFEQLGWPPIKRLTGSLYDAAAVDLLSLDAGVSRRLLVFNVTPIGSLLPLFGSRMQNRLTLTSDLAALRDPETIRKYDAVVMTVDVAGKQFGLANIPQVGFTTVVDNDHFIIAVNNERYRLQEVATLDETEWQLWSTTGDSAIHVDRKGRTISSATFVDAALISPTLVTYKPTFIEARFVGNLEAEPQRHAGHFSLHGQRHIFLIPPGDYSAPLLMRAITPKIENGQLSFGLGGWNTRGKGTLTLHSLVLKEITSP